MLKAALALTSGPGELGPSGSGGRGEDGVFTKLGLQTCRVSGRNYPFLPLAGFPRRCPDLESISAAPT